METRERQTLGIIRLDEYLHQLLHLQWCRDHPVACALLTVSALVAIGVVVTFFRPWLSRSSVEWTDRGI